MTEMMLHQSQSSIFMGLFYWQFDRKITVTSNQKMLNIDPDNLPGPTIGLAQVKFRNQQVLDCRAFLDCVSVIGQYEHFIIVTHSIILIIVKMCLKL